MTASIHQFPRQIIASAIPEKGGRVPVTVPLHFTIGSRVIVDGEHHGLVDGIRILTSPVTVIYDVLSLTGEGSLGSFPHFRMRDG